MARISNARGGRWIATLLAAGIVLPLTIVTPIYGALAMAALSTIAAIVLHGRVRALREAHDKVSGEIDVLSRHLLKVDALATAAAHARIEPQQARADDGADAQAHAVAIQEVTAEIALLSGIVRELASVVAAQDGEITRLRQQPPAVPAPTPSPTPSPAAGAVPLDAHRRQPVPARIGRPAIASVPSPATAPKPPDPDRDAALVDAFDGEGLDVWLQPIVALPQRKVVSYEALARLRFADETLLPEAFLPVLERHGRSTALDRRMLASVATVARHLQQRGSQAAIGYALSPLSLFEPDFLRSLKGLVSEEGDLSGRLALALPQASWRTLDAGQKTLLAELRGRIAFVLDRPSDLRFDAGLLTECGVVQVKVPASLMLRAASRETLSDIAVEDLVASLGRAGIRLVVTDVERDADVPDLIDLDVPLAQGAVFANPRAVRAEIVAGTPAPDRPIVPAPPTEPDPPRQRRPFRDFLRRAV